MNYNQEVVTLLLDKLIAQVPEVNQSVLRNVLEEVLCNYDVQPQQTALVIMSNIQNKIEIYLACKKLDGLAESTLYNYKLHLTRFAKVVRKNIEDITTMDIRMYLAMYQEAKKIQNTSLGNEINILKSFFGWMVDQEYLIKNPSKAIKETKTPKRMRKALDQEELERLRDACQTTRQRCILEVLFSTGCRLSELVDINISDINWSNMSLKVIGKGDAERIVYLSPKAKLYIQKYVADYQSPGRDDALFLSSKYPYSRLKNRAVEIEIHNIQQQAGFKKSIYPHLIRHTMATLALKSGASLTTIQKILGHTDPATTEIYAEIDSDTVRQEHGKYLSH